MKQLNSNLHKARKVKNDEFYTLYDDIKKEVSNYKEYFKGKVVFLPCDDMNLLSTENIEERMSQFWVFFHKNFEEFGLKKLIATSHRKGASTHALIYTGGSDEDVTYYDKIELKEDGDFRSPEIVDIMSRVDVIVTNPPFSLFRDFVDQIDRLNKKFLIIGSKNAYKYNVMFKMLMEGKWITGYNDVKTFKKPDGTIQKFGNIGWFTNIFEHSKRNNLVLENEYNPNEQYQKYETYDAINFNKVSEALKDYDGVMGVPLTFIDKYNPTQFEIVGMLNGSVKPEFYNFGKAIVEGKELYTRILIKKNRG